MNKFIGPIAIFTLLCIQASLSIGLSLLYDNNDLTEVGFAPNLGWQLSDNDYLPHTLRQK